MKNTQSFCVLLILLTGVWLALWPASAQEPIRITPDTPTLDLSRAVEIYNDYGRSFSVSTPPDPDGIVRRIEVQANSERSKGDWASFTLANTTDNVIDRLIVAPHYRLVNSGFLKPDLGSVRIHSITPSEGFALDRLASPDSDVFRLTLNPGAIITLVAELGTATLPQLYLWEPEAYKDVVNSYTLYRGILLGIAGLLAMLLTILFVVKGTSLFPVTAAFAWAVLAYIGIDFNFFGKLLTIAPMAEPIWRAGTEVALAATLVVFLFTYLHLHRWHYHFSFGVILWVLTLIGLGGMAIVDPILASALARASLGITGLIGVVLIGYLVFHGSDRAIMLIPTWALFIFWLLGAYATVTGRLDNDIIQSALTGGLVLIVLLIAFTVMQHAFAGGVLHQGLFSELERKALAVAGTGNIVWDWDVARDQVVTMPDLTHIIGTAAKNLAGPMRNWLPLIHGDDRDRFRATLDQVLDNRAGRLDQNFRLRAFDGQYHWFSLRARPVIGADGEIIRCVGMLMEITEFKRYEEKLLQNAITDNLTGLPNRQLFLDRCQVWCNLARYDERIRPTLLVIDFDDFRFVNQRYGLSVGDTFLLAMARRLGRHLKPMDVLCRLSCDRFAFLLVSQNDLSKLANFTIALKKTLNMPIIFADHEIKLTASIGMLPWLGGDMGAEERLGDAMLAMYHAKYKGGDRIEPFRPNFRQKPVEKNTLEQELKEALQLQKLHVVYHPVLKIADGSIAGFEALLQWDHPTRGVMFATDFTSAAENAGLAMPLAHFMLSRVAMDSSLIKERYPSHTYFVSVKLPDAQLIRQELVNGLQSILVRTPVRDGQILLEFSENALIENPELAISLFERIKNLKIGLVLDDFGSGYASLSYFSRFPFDMVKLDSILVTSQNERQKILRRALIAMAHDLQRQVIACGVEREDVALELKEARCAYLQSNTFSSPLRIMDAIALIESHNFQRN